MNLTVDENEQAMGIAANVMAETSAFYEEMMMSVQALSNVAPEPETRNAVWLAIFYYGIYLALRKLRMKTEAKQSEFQSVVKQKALFLLTEVIFRADEKDVRDEIKLVLEEDYDHKIDLYYSYVGDIRGLFRKILRQAYNENSVVKFVDNTMKTRLTLKVSSWLGRLGDAMAGSSDFEEKSGRNLFLNDKILDGVVSAITEAFLKLEIDGGRV